MQAETIGGAALLSLGVVTLEIILRGWLRWKRELKKYRDGKSVSDKRKSAFPSRQHEAQVFGNAVWYSYDYSIDTPRDHVVGHGMAMWRKTDGRWRILNMHNSLHEP